MGTQTDEESETSESESDTENTSSNNTRRKKLKEVTTRAGLTVLRFIIVNIVRHIN
jgi:D-alanyl-D-alanine dipeptidase